MSPESVILLMISGWLLVAASMLWGMLRLSRRYQAMAMLAQAEQTETLQLEQPLEPLKVVPARRVHKVAKPRKYRHMTGHGRLHPV